MTIPGTPTDWCPDCQEAVTERGMGYSHPTMCTVCGATLVVTPEQQHHHPQTLLMAPLSSPETAVAIPTAPSIRSDHQLQQQGQHPHQRQQQQLVQELQETADELRDVWGRLRSRMNSIRTEQQAMMEQLAAWQDTVNNTTATPNNNNDNNNNSHRTANTVLKNLPRTVLALESALFYQCTVSVTTPSDTTTTTSTSNSVVSSSSSIPSSESRTAAATAATTASSILSVEAIPGEFGQYNRHSFSCTNAVFLAAGPISAGSAGLLLSTSSTVSTIHSLLQHKQPFVLYFKRGSGGTFAQMARVAQHMGAVACVVGNHVAQPWPFCMRDSTTTTTTTTAAAAPRAPGGDNRKDDDDDCTRNTNSIITIPTVLVSQAHGRLIQQQVRQTLNHGHVALCTLDIRSTLSDDRSSLDTTTTTAKLPTVQQPVSSSSSSSCCAVCTDVYAVGDTIVTLPVCGHVFHDACAMTWLTRHNTCPYCRHALPFQDPELEHNRRQNGGPTNNNAVTIAEFYG